MSSTSTQLEEIPEPGVAAPAQARCWLRRLVWLALVCVALLVILYVFRAPVLTGVAEAWVVNEPATKADAIVILGGGLENRPLAAAKLFHEGIAPRILYMNVGLSPAQSLGIILPESEQTRRLLLSNDVPTTALTPLGTNVTSTYDESRAVRAWVLKTGATSLVIPTDLFHTRRARWIFGKELRGTKTNIHVVAINPLRYRLNNWWQHEEGVIAFQNEIVKYLYYRFKY